MSNDKAAPLKGSGPSASASGRPDWAAAIEWGLLAVGIGLFAAFLPHVPIGGDGATRFRSLVDLVDRHALSNARYSLAMPLAALPLYLLGKLAHDPQGFCARANVVFFALGLFLLHRELAPEAGPGLSRKFLLALVAASMFPDHLESFYGEVFSALSAAIGLAALARERRLYGWTLLALSAWNSPPLAIGLGLVLAYRVGMLRPFGLRALWRKRTVELLGPLAAAALILGEAWLRHGDPFASGYSGDHGMRTALPYSGQPGFSYPLFFGLLSLLFSAGKGLVFFAPGLLLPIRRLGASLGRAYGAQLLWLVFLAGLLLVYSRWWAWYGGWFWGPRFLLFASIPAAFAIAARLQDATATRRADLVTLAVLLLSGWVALDGAVFWNDPAAYDVCSSGGYAVESFCWYVPEWSPLWRPFIQSRPLSGTDTAVAIYLALSTLWLAASPVRRLLRPPAASGASGD